MNKIIFNKKFTFIFAITFVFALILSLPARGQKLEIIEQKTNIERLITEKMKETIATTLERSSYDVSVTVQLKEYKPKKADPRKQQKPTPAMPKLEDLQMGLIDAEELIKSYQVQIEELQFKKEEYNKVKDEKPLFEVTSVQVLVGLSSEFKPEYHKEFGSWLDKRVKADFGNIGSAAVDTIKKKETPPVEPKSIVEYIHDFQALIGVILSILGILVAALIFRSLNITNSEEQRKMQFTLQQAAASPAAKLDEIKELVVNQKKSDISLAANLKTLQELSAKVVALATQSGLDMNGVMTSWLDSGGFQKVAFVLDAILGLTHGTTQWTDIMGELSIPDGYKVSLVETYKNMRDIDIATKISILDSAYWDLMTFQTIGEQYLKTPFNYAASVDPRALKDAILVQPTKVKSLAVLSLPAPVQASLIAQLDSAQRLEILEGSIGLADFDKQEIDSISDALKFQINSRKNQKSTVSSFELLPSLLATFSPREETMYLAELWKRRSGDVHKLKFIWPTLAFIEQWKLEPLQKLLSVCSNEELEGLVVTLPQAQTAILNAVTPRVREMLGDSLLMLSKISPDEINKRLSTTRAKFLSQLKNDNMKLDDLYDSERNVSSAA